MLYCIVKEILQYNAKISQYSQIIFDFDAQYATLNLFDVPLVYDDLHIPPFNENKHTANDILQQI